MVTTAYDDQTDHSRRLSISSSVVDFGELYYSPTADFSRNIKLVTIGNESDSCYCVVRYCPSSELPLSLKISTTATEEEQHKDEDNTPFELKLGPRETKDLYLHLIPISYDSLSSQWGETTSYFKISSKVCLKYKHTMIHDDDDTVGNNLTTADATSDCPCVQLKFRASLCTSVLYVDEHDFHFGSCIINSEPKTHTFQIWNRSESILQCRLQQCTSNTSHPIDINVVSADVGTNVSIYGTNDDGTSSDYFQFQDIETDTRINIKDNEVISIAPFASRQLRVVFYAKVL